MGRKLCLRTKSSEWSLALMAAKPSGLSPISRCHSCLNHQIVKERYPKQASNPKGQTASDGNQPTTFCRLLGCCSSASAAEHQGNANLSSDFELCQRPLGDFFQNFLKAEAIKRSPRSAEANLGGGHRGSAIFDYSVECQVIAETSFVGSNSTLT